MRDVPPSPKKPLNWLQRTASRIVWGKWLLSFLAWELSGNLRWAPWKTFSEAVWDEEKRRPGTKRYVLAFALALADHMLFRTELRGSWAWALENVDEFESWLKGRDGA